MTRRPALGCLFEIVETLVLTLIIFLVIQTFVAQPYKVEQGSMEHTLEPDQYVLVDKLTPRIDPYRRGDVVVFAPPPGFERAGGAPFIKRVIGVGGDTVEVKDGEVFVNGTALTEPYLFADAPGVPPEPTVAGSAGKSLDGTRWPALPPGRPPGGVRGFADVRDGADLERHRPCMAALLADRCLRGPAHADLPLGGFAAATVPTSGRRPLVIPRLLPFATMKGIVLAGGTATRLYPLTIVTNKHLLPIYDRPMIYYPIETLAGMGVREVMVVVGGKSVGDVVELLGDGSAFGLDLTYRYQPGALGIAHAIGLARDFVGDDAFCCVLGDNILRGPALAGTAADFETRSVRRGHAPVPGPRPGALRRGRVRRRRTGGRVRGEARASQERPDPDRGLLPPARCLRRHRWAGAERTRRARDHRRAQPLHPRRPAVHPRATTGTGPTPAPCRPCCARPPWRPRTTPPAGSHRRPRGSAT